MGGMFKSKGSKSTSTQETKNENWLAQNVEYSNLVNQGIKEGSQMDMPGYELANYNQGWYGALQKLQEGANYGFLESGSQYLSGLGQTQLEGGLNNQQGAFDRVSRLADMSQDEFQAGFKSEYNSDLVNEQIAGLSDDVNLAYQKQVQGLNQQASASGNMGSSRAGVAQGVMAGQAQKAIASGSLQYRTAEQSAAFNRYSSMLGLQSQGANQLASLAAQQINNGQNLFNTSIGYQSQATAGGLSNQQNAINAGSLLQQQQQGQLDVNRMNELMKASPALARLGYMNNFLAPIANYSTSGTATNTTISSPQGNGVMGGLMGSIGSVAGAYFGGPLGAQLGGSLGGAIGYGM